MLSHWMAHHIAELINNVRELRGENQRKAKKECREAILALWKHRGDFPESKRPYGEVEPIIRAIASLDPEREVGRHFRYPRQTTRGDAKPEIEKWLDAAEAVDLSAKVIIRDFLKEATKGNSKTLGSWLEASEKAGVEPEAPERILRFIFEVGERGGTPEAETILKESLEKKLARLETFAKCAEEISEGIKKQLSDLESRRSGGKKSRKKKALA